MISSRLCGCDSLLFVYGTLRPFVEIPMARWPRSVATYVGPARARGRLYDVGPCPALRPERCEVGVARLRSRSAWVYVYRRVADPRARIPSGDYRLALRSRSQFRDR